MTPLAGPIVTAADMRAAEAASGVALDLLMSRAGAALAGAVMRLAAPAPVLVLCGPGNNGGDGYVAASLLAAAGADVRVAADEPPRTPLAAAARAQWAGPVGAFDGTLPGAILLDCIFGAGLSRRLAPALSARLRHFRTQAALTIATDLPSGIASDDGRDLGCAGADVTIALGAAKPAHLLQPGAARCGRVLLADLGIGVTSPIDVLARPVLRAPGFADHKYTRGMVAVVPGAMPGAATLGISAAARVAGYAILCGKGDAPAAIVRRGLDAVLGDSRLGAVLIGPGLDATPESRAKLERVLASAVPVVLDAGALALVETGALARPAPTIVTPHEGEFARLFGMSDGSKLDRARTGARLGATVVLKGSDTVIASPDGRITCALPATGWLASAGTGDVLAGVIAGLLASGMDAHTAACAGVWLQSEAARRVGPGLIADDLLAALPLAIASAAG